MNEPLEQRLFTSKEDITTFFEPKESLIDVIGSLAIASSVSIGLRGFGIPFFDVALGAGSMGAAHICINHYERKYDVELSEDERASRIGFLRNITIASLAAFTKAYFFSDDVSDSLGQSIVAYFEGCLGIAIPYYLIYGWRRPRDSDRRGGDSDRDDDDEDDNSPPGMKLDIPDYLPEDVGVEEFTNSN